MQVTQGWKGNRATPWLRVCKQGWAAVAATIFSAAALAVTALLYSLRARHVDSVDEDAYISLRYARNLIEGHGLVFNPGGERVEGITNLLWTLILAGGSWVSGLELPTVALVLGILTGGLTLLVSYLWCMRVMAACGLERGVAALIAVAAPLLLVLAPGFAFYSASGLETPFFALLLTCGLYAVSSATTSGSAQPTTLALGGLALGAATLTRPEGALALAAGSIAILAGLLVSAKSMSARDVCLRLLSLRLLIFCGGGGAVVLAATAWRLAYYGSALPNTAYAKSGALEVVKQWGVPYLLEASQATGFLAAWGLALAAAVVYRRFLWISLGALLLVPAWTAYVIYVGGDYMPSYRLFVPLLPAAFALAAATPAPLLAALGTRGGLQSSRVASALAWLLAVLPLAALAVFIGLQSSETLEEEREHRADNALWIEYRRASAQWFDEHDPDAVVAANAVGAFGYYSNVRIVDMLGLNDEYIARRGTENPDEPPGHQVGDGAYVLSREPDYIVPFGMKPGYRVGSTSPYFIGDRQLTRSEEFRAEYEPVEVKLESASGEQQDTLSMFRREKDPAGNSANQTSSRPR